MEDESDACGRRKRVARLERRLAEDDGADHAQRREEVGADDGGRDHLEEREEDPRHEAEHRAAQEPAVRSRLCFQNRRGHRKPPLNTTYREYEYNSQVRYRPGREPKGSALGPLLPLRLF